MRPFYSVLFVEVFYFVALKFTMCTYFCGTCSLVERTLSAPLNSNEASQFSEASQNWSRRVTHGEMQRNVSRRNYLNMEVIIADKVYGNSFGTSGWRKMSGKFVFCLTFCSLERSDWNAKSVSKK